MTQRVLVLGWAIRNSEYYVRLRQLRGDSATFTVRPMDWQYVRGVTDDTEVVLLGPLDMYTRLEEVDKVELALLSRGIRPNWTDTDSLMGAQR